MTVKPISFAANLSVRPEVVPSFDPATSGSG